MVEKVRFSMDAPSVGIGDCFLLYVNTASTSKDKLWRNRGGILGSEEADLG